VFILLEYFFPRREKLHDVLNFKPDSRGDKSVVSVREE
jgi:hypothetical protein